MKFKNIVFRFIVLTFAVIFLIGFKRYSEFEVNKIPILLAEDKSTTPFAELMNRKLSTEHFVDYSLFSLNSSANQTSVNKFVKTATLLKLDYSFLKSINQSKPGNINFSIPIDGKEKMVLELTQVSLLTEEYARKNSFNPGLQYQGRIKGNPNSVASISICDNWVMGLVSDETGNYVLGTIKDKYNKLTSNYIFYNDKDMLVKSNFHCMTDDIKNYKSKFKEQSIIPHRNPEPFTTKPVHVYFVADYQMYLDANLDTNLLKQFITNIFNESQMIYASETYPIPRQISDIYVYTSPDPYINYTSSTDILNNFGSDTRDNFNGDLAQLLSTGHGGQLGGIAWINVLCASYNPSDYSGRYSFCNIETTYSHYPTYSWTVEVITHEMGHNLGSRHTHACVWPVFTGGGTGAIDSCYPAEGNCFMISDTTPNYHGTIMSYCHLGGYIDFNYGFGILPDDTIWAGYSQASCIDTALNISEVPVAYSLLQNYPNPFNPSTTIKFALPKEGYVSLVIYDVTGRTVTQLLSNRYYNVGVFTLSLDAVKYGLSSGVYFYRLNVVNANKEVYSNIKKMVLIK